MNVLDTAGTPAEVAARIKALMPSAGTRQGDPFFEEYPLALLERLATVQAALGQRWTLEGLYAPAVLRHHLEALLAAYLSQRLQAGEGQRLEALIAAYTRQGRGDLVADALIDDLQKPRDHFTKVTSNLIPAFRGVVGAPLGPLLSTVPGDLTWTRIVEQGQVVYVALASLLLGEVAHRIGRVILQDLVGYLGRRYAYDVVDTAPSLTVLIDEFGDVAYPLFTTALNKGGGANARFILAQQSLADAEAAMGPAQARRVLDNLNTKIWCRLADDRTAAEATEGLGPVYRAAAGDRGRPGLRRRRRPQWLGPPAAPGARDPAHPPRLAHRAATGRGLRAHERRGLEAPRAPAHPAPSRRAEADGARDAPGPPPTTRDPPQHDPTD